MWFFRSHFFQVFYVFFLLLLGTYSWFSLEQLPVAQNLQASQEVFSAARAMEHVKRLARSSRHIGTPAHDISRDYIMGELAALGCQVTLQKTPAATLWRYGIFSGHVENIICTIAGNKPDALLLMTHYDSVHLSPGAADSAAGVSVLLETARALRLKSHENTLILLFTDGEENGLLGSSAFVKSELPKRFNVRALMNFEGRGNSGPLALFETHRFNSFASLALNNLSRPFGNSFLDLLYQFLPNDTDLSPFKTLNLPALNFAFARGLEHYHHSSDTAENLAPETLQHAGDTALAVSENFLQSKLESANKIHNAVLYQDILGLKHLSYSPSLVKLLSLLIVVGILICLWAWRPHPLKLILATVVCGFFLALSLLSAYFFQKLLTFVWTPIDVISHFYIFFLALMLMPLGILHFFFLKIKFKYPELNFGILVLLLALSVAVQFLPELGTLVVWSAAGVVIACVRPTPLWRNLALFPIFLLLPAFLHTALIADSGTQFVFPTLVLCFVFALLQLCFMNPHLRSAQSTPTSPEIEQPNAHSTWHVLGLVASCLLLGLSYSSLLTSKDKKRVDFFELYADDKLYVALSKNAKETQLLENKISDPQKDALLNELWSWRIKASLFSLFETKSFVEFPTQVDFSHWAKDSAPTQYLIDVPVQDFDCVSIDLSHFKNLQELKVNSQTVFTIPLKKFTSVTGPSFAQSCNLKTSPLRLEFQVSTAQSIVRDFNVVFLKNTRAPKELNVELENSIMGAFSNTLYILKKITL